MIGKGSECWYERPKNYHGVKLFGMRDVLSEKVEAAKQSEETGEPPVLDHLQSYNASEERRSLCRKVDYQEWRDLFCEKHTREKMVIVDIVTEDEEKEVKEVREEAAKEKAKADEKARKALKLKSLCHLPPLPKPKRKKPKPKDKSKEPALLFATTKPKRRRKKG